MKQSGNIPIFNIPWTLFGNIPRIFIWNFSRIFWKCIMGKFHKYFTNNIPGTLYGNIPRNLIGNFFRIFWEYIMGMFHEYSTNIYLSSRFILLSQRCKTLIQIFIVLKHIICIFLIHSGSVHKMLTALFKLV